MSDSPLVGPRARVEALARLARTASARRHLAAARRAEADGDLAAATARAAAGASGLTADVEQRGGAGAGEAASALHELGRLCRAAVDLPGAVTALDEAMRVLGEHPEAADHAAWVCESLTVRGDTLRLLGRHDDARADLEAALDAAPSPVMRAGASNALGILCKDVGDLEAADGWYRTALAAAEGTGERRQLAAILHNLAGLAYARGDYAAGESSIGRAIELRGDPPDDAAALLSDRTVLAALQAGARRDHEARPLLEELIDAWTALRGAEHYEVAHCRHHLGLLLVRAGDTERAHAELDAAHRALRRVLGADHPEVRAVSADLAKVPDPGL